MFFFMGFVIVGAILLIVDWISFIDKRINGDLTSENPFD